MDAVFKSIVVEPTQAGKRLDRFLVDVVPDLSRARVKAMIDAGQVRVDGRRSRKGDAVAAGATVELLAPPPPRDFSPVPQLSSAVAVRFEDRDVAVLEKPTGMPTAPLRADETGTLANDIAARYPETAGIGFARHEPGLLHRLDTETSGLVVVARTAEAFDALRKASRDGLIHKRYLALVEGKVVSEGRVDYPLVPHRKDPKRVESVTPNVRLRAGTKTNEAHTRYKPSRALRGPEPADGGTAPEFTLLEVEVETAFRHQVRVHLATIGHPLLGDTLYRGPVAAESWALARHFLHASEVVFPHPRTGVEARVESALPADLAAVLDKFE